MKQEHISASDSANHWLVEPEENNKITELALAEQIMNIMEQGILVWSDEGVCELHNTRIFEVLELDGSTIGIGTTREEFRERAIARGEISTENAASSDAKISAHQPYSFDMILGSGRVVLTNARPARGGGYVVTFTDVTKARRAAKELALAKKEAEAAQRKAQEILYQERTRQAAARRLAELDEWLQSCQSLDELYKIVTRFMGRLLPGSKGELYLYSNSRDALVGTCKWNTTDLHTSIGADSCWALRRGRAYEYESDGLCFVCDHVEAHKHDVDVNEYICLPIVAHGDTVGLLHIRFDHTDDGAAHVAEHAEFAIRCAEHIAMAIANVKLRDELHDQSIRDPLTGLYNRRYFMDAMRREIARAERGDAGFGLMSLDADKFKAFNDNHGHDAGDMVLRAISDRMQQVAEPGGICCRMGGEEFAILLPSMDMKQTGAIAERLRDEISQLEVRTAFGLLPRITISAGICAFSGGGASPNGLLKIADEALYEAKQAGRNCVKRGKKPVKN